MVSYSLPATPTFHHAPSQCSSLSSPKKVKWPQPLPNLKAHLRRLPYLATFEPGANTGEVPDVCFRMLPYPVWETGELVAANLDVFLYKNTHNFILPNCFCVLFTGVPKTVDMYLPRGGDNDGQAVIGCAKGEEKCPYWVNLAELVANNPDLPRQEYARVVGYHTPEHPLTQINQTRTFSSIKEEDDFGILPTFSSQGTAKACSPVKGTALQAPDFGVAQSLSAAKSSALEAPHFGVTKLSMSPQKVDAHPLFRNDEYIPMFDLTARFYSPPPCEEIGWAVEDAPMLSQADTLTLIWNLFAAGSSGVMYRELCMLLGKCYNCSRIMTRDRIQEHQCPREAPDPFSPVVAGPSKVEPPKTPGTPVPILRDGEKAKKKRIFLKAAKPPVAGSSKRAQQVVAGGPAAKKVKKVEGKGKGKAKEVPVPFTPPKPGEVIEIMDTEDEE